MTLWGMAKLGRPKAALVITDVERTELVRLTKRAHVNRLLAFRARLVLAFASTPPSDAAVGKAVWIGLQSVRTDGRRSPESNPNARGPIATADLTSGFDRAKLSDPGTSVADPVVEPAAESYCVGAARFGQG